MFERDDYVFYGSGGVCRISDIQTAPLDSMPADQQYYVMQSLHDPNGVMYIPVDNDKIFLRRLLNREEAEELLDRIPFVTAIEEKNSKLLRDKYAESMRMNDPLEWVRVIKTVYLRTMMPRSRTQRISETERSFAESAKRFLYTELSLALKIPETDMESYITRHIEQQG